MIRFVFCSDFRSRYGKDRASVRPASANRKDGFFFLSERDFDSAFEQFDEVAPDNQKDGRERFLLT